MQDSVENLCVCVCGRSPPFPSVSSHLTAVYKVHVLCPEWRDTGQLATPCMCGFAEEAVGWQATPPQLFAVSVLGPDQFCLCGSIIRQGNRKYLFLECPGINTHVQLRSTQVPREALISRV